MSNAKIRYRRRRRARRSEARLAEQSARLDRALAGARRVYGLVRGDRGGPGRGTEGSEDVTEDDKAAQAKLRAWSDASRVTVEYLGEHCLHDYEVEWDTDRWTVRVFVMRQPTSSPEFRAKVTAATLKEAVDRALGICAAWEGT